MKKPFYVLPVLFLFGFSSCKPNQEHPDDIDSSSLTIIEVPPNNGLVGNFRDFFSEVTYIPLETKEESLIGNIDRLAFYDGKLYILDRNNNSLLIFDKEGKFLSKIHRVGNGPGEYQSLMDFAIDKTGQQLLLYSDRPYRLFYFDLDGKYIDNIRLNELCFNIASIKGKVQLLKKEEVDLLTEISHQEGGEQRRLLKNSPKGIFFSDFLVKTPSLTTDSKLNILLPYSDTVYTYNGDKLSASYVLDFGDRKALDDPSYQDREFIEIYRQAVKEDLGFPVFNFRETQNYIMFSYGANNMVLYNKSSAHVNTYRTFKKEGDPILFTNYFAHDGTDNSIMAICQAHLFLKRVEAAVEDVTQESLPKNIESIAEGLTELNNPVLVKYTFK